MLDLGLTPSSPLPPLCCHRHRHNAHPTKSQFHRACASPSPSLHVIASARSGRTGILHWHQLSLSQSVMSATAKMNNKTRVLVVGCSSGVGLEVTKTLLTEGDRFQVFALVRDQARAAKAIAYGSSRVNFIHGDVTKPETLVPACQGMDAIVCTIGARAGWRMPCWNNDTPKCVDYQGVKNLAEAAAYVGVQKFVLVSSAAVTRTCDKVSCMLNCFLGRVLRWKFKGEEAVRRAYRHEDLAYYIIRPGRLTNNLGGLLGLSIEQGDQGNGSTTRIDVASVALACVEGHCTPNVTFEVFNNSNKYAPAEDLNKLYSLYSDEPVVEDSEITGRLLP